MAQNVLAKVAVEISANVAAFNAGLDKAGKKLNRFESSLNSIKKALGAAFIADKLIDVGKAIINTTAEFQKFEAVLTNGLGSGSAARSALTEITKFAAKTPFEVEELTRVFVKWTNTGLNPSIEKLGKLGDVASSLGAGFEQTAEAFKDLAVGQTRRIEEIGIIAKSAGDKIQLSFKGTTIEVNKSAQGVDAALNVFSKLPGVLGASAAVSATLTGKISNFNDNVSILAKSIGDRTSGVIGGFLDFANNALGSVNQALNRESELLQEQQINLNVLVGAITDANISEAARAALITELNQKYPEFLAGLSEEERTNKKLNERLEDVNKQYIKKIALATATERLTEKQNEINDLYDEEIELRLKIEKLNQKQVTGNISGGKGGADVISEEQKKRQDIIRLTDEANKNVEKQKEKQKELADVLNVYIKKAEEAAGLEFFAAKTGGSNADKTPEELAAEKAAAEKAAAEKRAKILAEARKKALEQDKLFQEAQMALMSERQAAEYKATIDFEKTLNDAQESGFKDTELLEKAYYANLADIKAKYDKKELESITKQQEEKSKALEAAEKIAQEAFMAQLSERQAAEFQAGLDFIEKQKTLQEAGITDLTAIQAQYRLELLKINEKYDKEDQDRLQKQAKLILKLNEQQIENLNALNDAFKNTAQQGVQEFLVGLGDVAAGNISFGDNLLKAMTGFMKSFGQNLIAIGIGKEAFDKLFKKPGSGPIAIAAGIALIAAAGAINSSMARKAQQASGGSGGGGGGTGFSSQTVSAQNIGSTISITGELKGSGRDLVAVINQTSFDNKVRKGG